MVLAGGKSSRMGRDKALMEYCGLPLIESMINLLHRTDLCNVYVSGDIEGYNCIKDSTKFEGPARAIIDVMVELPDYSGALFIPVDMPLLTPEILQLLLNKNSTAYFKGRPLPCFISKPCNIKSECSSVHELLEDQGAVTVDLPAKHEEFMHNFNTTQEWAELITNES